MSEIIHLGDGGFIERRPQILYTSALNTDEFYTNHALGMVRVAYYRSLAQVKGARLQPGQEITIDADEARRAGVRINGSVALNAEKDPSSQIAPILVAFLVMGIIAILFATALILMAVAFRLVSTSYCKTYGNKCGKGAGCGAKATEIAGTTKVYTCNPDGSYCMYDTATGKCDFKGEAPKGKLVSIFDSFGSMLLMGAVAIGAIVIVKAKSKKIEK